MNEKISTTIQDLTITLRKVVGDDRGKIAELLPGGFENPDASVGIKHIYTSIATGLHTARAGHYHNRKGEFFYTVTGTALWVFYDFRKDSATFGKTFSMVVGWSPFPGAANQYVLEEGKMAQGWVPAGVYHVYWPLTAERVLVVCMATTPHDEDYVRIKPEEISEVAAEARTYGIPI